MPWQVIRKLKHRDGPALTFELTLAEDGVLRDALELTVDCALGVHGIKAELTRAARVRAQEIMAERRVAKAGVAQRRRRRGVIGK